MSVSRRTWAALMTLAFILPAAIGFGAVYVMARGADNDVAPTVPLRAPKTVLAQAAPAAAANPLSQGDMAKFVFKREPEPMPEITFVDGTGAAKSLNDFKGKVVLAEPLGDVVRALS